MNKKTPGFGVLHISAARTWRGGEQQLGYLAAKLRASGIRQLIFCVKGSAMEAFCRREGFDFLTFRKGFPLNPVVGRQIKKLCKKHSIDILHSHDSHAHTFAMISVLWGNKVPLVVHRRVDFPIGGNFFSGWKYNHHLVKKIICVSRGILEITAPGIRDVSKLTVIYSGIDFARFGLTGDGLPAGEAETANKLRRAFHIPSGQFIIANLAAIAPHKDYFTFVKTAEILLARGLSAKFLLIGEDGGEEESIRQFIREKALESHFIFTGFRNDIPSVLPEIDLLLFTSKTEGLGGAILEAFVCRVPVVATAAGGVPEIVEHASTGLLAPVGDAEELANQVLVMLNDYTLREKLVSQAFEKVKQFSKEKMAEGILAVYQNVLVRTK